MKTLAIVDIYDPIVVGYENLYEEGDRWEKIKGCDGCENIKQCCGNCQLLFEKGCLLHVEPRVFSTKPLKCIIYPLPIVTHSWCQLEFKCVKGSMKGKIRRVRDPRDTFS